MNITISSLKQNDRIDECLPPIEKEEYKQLEADILKNGITSPILIWNNILVDGRNRVEIYKKYKGKVVPAEVLEADSIEEVIGFRLLRDLGKRNLSSENRAYIAVKYENIIRDGIRKGLWGKGDHTRDVLAEFSATSPAMIQRVKFIYQNGSKEQIERLLKGGGGKNNSSALQAEIKEQIKGGGTTQKKVCCRCGRIKAAKMFIKDRNVCIACEKGRWAEKQHLRSGSHGFESINKTIETLKTDREISYQEGDAINEMTWAADDMISTWESIIAEHHELFIGNKNILTQMTRYLQSKLKEVTV